MGTTFMFDLATSSDVDIAKSEITSFAVNPSGGLILKSDPSTTLQIEP